MSIHNCLIWLGVFFSSLSLASNADLARDVADGLKLEGDKLRGKWRTSSTWKSTFCQGRYHYDIEIRAQIKTVDLKVTEDGSLNVYGDLRDLYAYLSGEYKSSTTACIPFSGAIRAWSDRGQVNANVQIIEGKPGTDPAVKVRVQSTELDQIQFKSPWIPNWFEDLLTGLVNRALAYVWGSSLGEWIGEKISDLIEESGYSDSAVSVFLLNEASNP